MRYLSSIIIASIMSIVFLMSSCRDDRHWIKGEGPNVTNTRRVSNFNGISLSFSADVQVVKDSTFTIELRGQQNVLDVIETRVKGSTLEIYVDYHYHIRKNNPVTIVVHMPDLSRADVNGSGKIECLDPFYPDNMSANVNGSGEIRLAGNVESNFTANVNGSGSIYHNGSGVCSRADFSISGSGYIQAESLKTEQVYSSISGSGTQIVYALDRLDVHISGSGDVYYRGTPTIIKNISGSGKVISL